MIRKSPLLVLCFASLAPAFVHAQWSSLPNVPNALVTLPAGTEVISSPRTIVRDGAGGAFILWSARPDASADHNIYVQHVAANGSLPWGVAGKPVVSAAGEQIDFGALADGVGGLYVVWEDRRAGNNAGQYYAQRLDADGDPLWAADGVALPHPGLVPNTIGSGPQLVLAPDGGVYAHYSLGTESRVQRLTADGNVAAGWPAEGVTAHTSAFGVRSYALVASQADDETEPGVLALARNVAVKISAAGVKGFTTTIAYNTQGAITAAPQSVCGDGAGGLLIAATANQFVWVYRVTKDGTLAWPNTESLVTGLSGGGYAVNLVPAGDGGGIVVWGRSFSGGPHERRAQRFSATGEMLWEADGVVFATGNIHAQDESLGVLTVSDGAGGIVTGWRITSPANQFLAQRLDGNGQKLWGSDGVVVSSGVGSLDSMTTDDASGAIYFHSSNTTTFHGMRTTLTGSLGSNSPLARLVNISARAQVGGGDDVLIPGFIVTGGEVELLVRGVGPTLAALNVTGVLADPQLTLFNSSNQAIGSNDDWGAAPNAATIATVAQQVSAFALPADSKDAALHVTLAPGLYTAVMRGAGDTTGVGLVEMYEVGGAANSGRIGNMSVRARVGTGDGILIPGIVVGGSEARTLLIRAIGPTLSILNVNGVLADPQLTLFNHAGTQLAVNDNWNTPNGTQIATISAQVGAFALPAGSKDAAFLITLSPGLYTAQVSGVDNTTGVCLVEVYEVQ